MSLLSQVAETQPAEGEAQPKKVNKTSEYQKKQRELAKQRAETIAAYLDGQSNVPENVKDAIDGLLKRGKYEHTQAARNGAAGNDSFKVLFGDNPTVGTVVTAQEMFNKIHKGLSDMRKLIKKWAEKGNVVTFDDEKFEYKLEKLA